MVFGMTEAARITYLQLLFFFLGAIST